MQKIFINFKKMFTSYIKCLNLKKYSSEFKNKTKTNKQEKSKMIEKMVGKPEEKKRKIRKTRKKRK